MSNLLEIVSMVIPQPMLQHQPTKKRMTVLAWPTPIAMLIRNAMQRLSPLSIAENLVCARCPQQQHMTKNPLKIVPEI